MGRYHLFLSHIWSTGQDQCASIKQRLCLLLPGVQVFLDVDDLEDIGALEEYVDATAVIMIFVSKGYFKSGNCLREARCTLAKQKPITLMYDAVRGGEKLDVIVMEECPKELREPIFDQNAVIEWHRIKDFQLVSLRLLAEQLLLGCPVCWATTRIESTETTLDRRFASERRSCSTRSNGILHTLKPLTSFWLN